MKWYILYLSIDILSDYKKFLLLYDPPLLSDIFEPLEKLNHAYKVNKGL